MSATKIPSSGTGTNNPKKNYFGSLLKYYRKKYGNITQKDLADGLPGKTWPSSVSRYENGLLTVPPDFVYGSAQYLKLNDDEMSALVFAVVWDNSSQFMTEFRELVTKRKGGIS